MILPGGGFIQNIFFSRRKLDVHCTKVIFQLLHRIYPHDRAGYQWVCQQPSQGHLGERSLFLLRQAVDLIEQYPI